MHWNHRLIKRKDPNGEEPDYYSIHEVYYNDDGNITGCTMNGVAASGESADEVKKSLNRMIECLDKPILDYDDDIPGVGP